MTVYRSLNELGGQDASAHSADPVWSDFFNSSDPLKAPQRIPPIPYGATSSTLRIPSSHLSAFRRSRMERLLQLFGSPQAASAHSNPVWSDFFNSSDPLKPPQRIPPIPYGATSSTLRRSMPPTYPQTLPDAFPPIGPLRSQYSRPVTSITTITVP
ncbi:hypothetical protein L596_001292 [Steinernema carpocapsae]|uniref:Uncharacterized protein n=1 Tax=Steinernema carpocapsae TaxID=34508 RepID=A0A4U8UPW2_STECR|nr:hypothetical protein L596_001292 [Steinernema carpocapsae]